jgi:uncharacterized protein (TIGR02444 family)
MTQEASGRDADWPLLTGPHWTFALEVYGDEGVSAACLDLQDRRMVDVNVLLMAAYGRAVLGRELGPDEVAGLDAQVRDWRAAVVWPLRAVRRHLKPMVTGSGVAPVQRLRDSVKALELEAEQIELARLAEHLTTLGRAGTNELSGLARTLGAVVAFYSPDGSADEADHAATEVISRAVTGYVARRPVAD